MRLTASAKGSQWQYACGDCGRVIVLRTYVESIEHECRPREPRQPCVHLGEPTGAVALVRCATCRGNVRLKLPVHRCGVHGACVPGAAQGPERSDDWRGRDIVACGACRAGGLGFEASR